MRPSPLIGPPGIPGMPWQSLPVSPGLTRGVRQVTQIPIFPKLCRENMGVTSISDHAIKSHSVSVFHHSWTMAGI